MKMNKSNTKSNTKQEP
uniref:Uncharacterized protein n=1 Tax=Rhizophora mucronata TaxID=61149 RepID=A0A2P2PHQ6_RHIMU